MTTFWVVLLRASGTLVFLFGVGGGTLRLLAYANTAILYSLDPVFDLTLRVVKCLVLAVICFGIADGLKHLAAIDTRLKSVAARRRRMEVQPETRSVAPDAPHWPELKPGVHAEIIERRLARSRRTGTDNLAELFEKEFIEWQRERSQRRSQ